MSDVIDISTRRRAPSGPWYRIEAAASDEAELFIYGDIGQNFFGDGTSAEALVQELSTIKAKLLNVRINSHGGSVFDGLAIYNALARHPAKVITHVDGIAASIASVIALAGKEVRIAKNAFLMIHNASGMAFGTAQDMRQMAETLDTVTGSLVGVYVSRTGKSEAEVKAWMDAETWFNAAEAKAAGFVDVVTKDLAIAASYCDLSSFRKVPADVAALVVEAPGKQGLSDDQMMEMAAARHRIREMGASIRRS